MKPIHDIDIITRNILDGDFRDFDGAVTEMLKRYPLLQAYMDSMCELSTRVDLDRYARQDLIPRMQQGCNLANCQEWLMLMRTRIIGAY